MAMQGPLLANYSQSFIEQLRNASLPYSSKSTVGLKRRLQSEDNSSLERFLVWLKLTVKKRLPWGEAAAHHKRKHLVIALLIIVPSLHYFAVRHCSLCCPCVANRCLQVCLK